MSSLIDVPGLVTTLLGAALLAGAGATGRRMLSRRPRATQQVEATAPLEGPRMLRRYTLLRTTGPNGVPAQYDTTRPPGTVITHPVNGHPQRFELTDVPFGDGSFVAEPVDYL
ncbi:hypothetical protein ACIQNT_38990 [Streptomyces luteogriseus]|uniref:hypothetical protein n=1 Tax=Streptomyces luteogriseus TaxID=68233 RepID=UPI00382E12F0